MRQSAEVSTLVKFEHKQCQNSVDTQTKGKNTVIHAPTEHDCYRSYRRCPNSRSRS
jgi:hypothetical protein